MDNNFENSMELRVLLLALYKKEDNESFKDILLILENNRLFDKKTGKRFLKKLKELKFIEQNQLTFLGIQKAKEVEAEFTL